MCFGTLTMLMGFGSVFGCFCTQSSKERTLENVRSRVCHLPLLDEAANRHRGSCKENLSLSLLPATSAAYPCFPGSAQAVLVPPLLPRSVQSVYVHCRTGGGQDAAFPRAAAGSGLHPLGSCSGTDHSPNSSEITPRNRLWTEICSAAMVFL